MIDVDRRLLPDDRNWLADEIHPNDRGYQLMAEGMLEIIRGEDVGGGSDGEWLEMKGRGISGGSSRQAKGKALLGSWKA